MEIDKTVGLEMDGLCVVRREESESFIEGIGVTGEGEGKVGEVMSVDLRFVCA